MHIFKSRNPLWLILDVILTIWFWKISLYLSAIFFSIDTLIQLVYTFFPDAVDTWEKNKSYRIFYMLFWLLAIYFVLKHFIDTGRI